MTAVETGGCPHAAIREVKCPNMKFCVNWCMAIREIKNICSEELIVIILFGFKDNLLVCKI